MTKACNTCGYRINPDTARRAGLTSQKSPYLYDYCYLSNDFVQRQRNCPNWVSYEELDYEKKYFQKANG